MRRDRAKIGREVFIHGFIDEIRKDIIIIKNDGGYFGTSIDEVLETPVRQGHWLDDKTDDIFEDSYYANCSHCGYQIDIHHERGYLNYCPNCGSYMSEG